MSTSSQPYGISLPIRHGQQGYFQQTYSALEQIRSNMRLLLNTKKGERRMNPEFGSGLWSVLFEQISDDLSIIIDSTIRRDINRWMPYVNIKSINITKYPDDNYNRLDISVIFTVPKLGATDEETLTVAMNTTSI